jgi:predicted ATPase/DNA-binding XRE family transcriptional regulator
LDLTREELAERIGYSAATVRKIEDEERHPSVQVVERLAEIFNIPQTERTVFLRFARGDWRSAPTQSVEDAPWRASGKSTPSKLPATTTSLIGREKEIWDVQEYLLRAEIRLVTLIGPPGIGKTRLSIEAARTILPNFPDGVFFVPLAPLDDSSLIAQAIAGSLGYVSAQNLSTEEQLLEGTSEKAMLLVLDNCEHLIEGVASLVSDLLSACPRLKILATSRESLRIPGEWLYPVPAFDVPKEAAFVDMENISKFHALTLFTERARAVRPEFVLDLENIKTVSAICGHLDGLPLAIELIAARMRLMSPEALLTRLNDQFILSADGMRAPSERQKTLSDAIRWSYNLLSAEEQKLFAYLSVFSGGFTLDVAESIFSRSFTRKPVRDLIASLLDKSLLQYVSDHKARNEPRYTMLVTIQEFARDRLRQTGEESVTRNWHLAYFLDLAQNADKELRGPNQLEWLHRLGAEVDNLRAGLDWAIETGQTETALQMARRLHWFWAMRGDHTEGSQWLGRALEMPEASLHSEAQAEALTQLTNHIFLISGKKEARPFAEQALSIARAHEDKHNTARALHMLALVLMYETNFAAAQSTFKESMSLYLDMQDEYGHALVVALLASLSWRQGNGATALALSQQALEVFQKRGDRFWKSVALRLHGSISMKQGDVANGMKALRESLILAQQLDSKHEIARTLWRFVEAAHSANKFASAVRLYWAARNVGSSIGVLWWEQEAEFESNLAMCRAALGELAFATAVEEGRAMTMEQAISYALEDHDD